MNKDFWKGKNVFITGSDGFIASWITKQLVEFKSNVTVVIREPNKKNALDLLKIREKVNIVKGDILDLDGIKKIFNYNSIEYCFHLAAQAIVGDANTSPLPTFEANIQGTWNILEAARCCKTLKGMTVASSDKAYGDQKILPYQENQPLNGLYPYDASKACTDILSRSYAKIFSLPIAVTRCANIYGGADLHMSRIVPGTIAAVLKNEIPTIRSDGTLERDYMYIEDAVNAYLVLAENLHRDEIRGEAFNFGTQNPISVLELFKKIISACESNIKPKILGQNKGEITSQSLEIKKAQKLLNWNPTTNLEDGLKKTISWYKNNRILWDVKK
jgi:CDP-glucose 4,6-dehydratase